MTKEAKTFGGLPSTGGPFVMGTVNVTPDSFSDGGRFHDARAAIEHGLRLWAEGAHILDVGGESTRPGAAPVSVAQEMDRVLPVIEALAADGVRVSVDTRHAAVMDAAVRAGAAIINDVTALEGDGSLETAARLKAPVVLMHMQGAPGTMQENPVYGDVVAEVRAYLESRIQACESVGIDRADICVDPGIGFGKTAAHNAALIAHLDAVAPADIPVLLGVSRKSFIAHVSNGEPADQRLAGSLAAHLAGVARGARFLRVHDVAETVQALAVWRAVEAAR